MTCFCNYSPLRRDTPVWEIFENLWKSLEMSGDYSTPISDLVIENSAESIPLQEKEKCSDVLSTNHKDDSEKLGHNIYSSRRPSSLHQTTFSGRNYYSMPAGEHGTSVKDNRTSISSHLFLLPPSPGRRFSRQRQGSSVSNVSVDNMSNLSGSTLAYFLQNSEDIEGFL